MLTRRAWLLGASAGLGVIVGRSCGPTNAPGPLVTLKVADLAALLNAFPLGDPGVEHVFDY